MEPKYKLTYIQQYSNMVWGANETAPTQLKYLNMNKNTHSRRHTSPYTPKAYVKSSIGDGHFGIECLQRTKTKLHSFTRTTAYPTLTETEFIHPTCAVSNTTEGRVQESKQPAGHPGSRKVELIEAAAIRP
jgi:hypothetical protein